MKRTILFTIFLLFASVANAQTRSPKPITKIELFSYIENGDEREIMGLTDGRLVEMLEENYAIVFGLNPWKAHFDGGIYCHEFGNETPYPVNVAEAIKQTLAEHVCASDANLCRKQRRSQTDFRAELFQTCKYAEPFYTGVEKLLRDIDILSPKYVRAIRDIENENILRKNAKIQASEARVIALKNAEEERKRLFAIRLIEIQAGKRTIENVAESVALTGC